MAKSKKVNKDDEMTLYEKAMDYTILSREDFPEYTITTIRTHNGCICRCKEPKHTPEELEKLSADICEALIRFVHPDWDLSECKEMRILVEPPSTRKSLKI